MRGTTEEPHGLPREESVLWKKVFTDLWGDRISKNQIAADLHLPPDELENLVTHVPGCTGFRIDRRNQAARASTWAAKSQNCVGGPKHTAVAVLERATAEDKAERRAAREAELGARGRRRIR